MAPEVRLSLHPERPLVIAHRGASAYRPENTLPAYELALEQRADMIEIDLHLTRDAAIVIAHDADLRHIGHAGAIADLTLAEVRELDAGHGTEIRARVPTLDEVLDAFGGRIPFNLEIKWGRGGHYPGLEAATLAAVEKRGLLPRTLFSSFRDGILAELRRLSPAARLAVLVDLRHAERVLERAEAVAAEAVNPHYLLANESFIEDAHAAGLAVYPYTIDEEEQMDALVALGVDGLFTNRPDAMRALLHVQNVV
jgi:glycerophosphoryl diester phosphodiesterase